VDVVLVGGGLEVRIDARVEKRQVLLRDRAVADGVEQLDEAVVLLPVDLLQLDELHLEAVKDAGAEEVGAGVERLEQHLLG